MLHNEQALSRRLIAIVLALSLLCSLGVGVFADGKSSDLEVGGDDLKNLMISSSCGSDYTNTGEIVTLTATYGSSCDWYHGDTLYEQTSTNSLSFVVSADTTGLWYCVVDGTKSQTVYVGAIDQLASNASTYTYGESVTLSIPINPLISTTVVWYHDGVQYGLTGIYTGSYNSKSANAKETFTMSSSMAGEWYCTLNGTKSNTITITQIGDDPVMTLSADKTVYSDGDSVTLAVTNIPPDDSLIRRYQFYRDGKEAGGLEGNGYLAHTSSSLTITLDPQSLIAIAPDDGIEGEWYCIIGGERTNTITLTRTENIATQSNSAAKTLVRVSATPATFKVTVPSALAFSVSADGTVTAPSNLEIANESNGPVCVSDVTVNTDCEWSIDANGTDYQKVPVDSKQLTLSLNGDNTPATAAGSQGALTLTPASWPTINGNSDLAITAEADFAEQGAVLTNTSVCHVVYTVSWYTGT